MALFVTFWAAHERALARLGASLVHEDAREPVDVVVISNADVRGGALEAAALYRAHFAQRIVIPAWQDDPLDDELRALSVPALGPTRLAREILLRSGVPEAAITVLGPAVDGTGSETDAIARFARSGGAQRLLFLTARTHTARAHWLLDRRMPPGVHASVRSPERDTFRPDAWWRSTDDAREVAFECLRWLHDLACAF